MPVHLRLNDKDTSRNPYINFVTALPGPRHDEALRRLQQLAAMAKPLMEDQAFHINSLEEYEYNQEFSGRCWNNGEVVELVLTGADGSWRPLQFVLYVFCHELAHIKHMNHIPHLHGALTSHLKQLALAKQKQGYFGDGLWSSGRQLQDGGFVSGLGMGATPPDLPDNVCGGAFRRARGRSLTRRRGIAGSARRGGRKKFKGPSLNTGAQTAANTRGGNRRVKLEVGVEGSGNRVDGRDWIPAANAKSREYKLDENSTFRKRTQSKEAREKRAAAALARFSAMQTSSLSSVKREEKLEETDHVKEEDEEDSVTEDEEEYESEYDPELDALVGNDLGEHDGAGVEGEQEQHFTQAADGHETAEQRRRRMKRFDDKHNNPDNTWAKLLSNSNVTSSKRKGSNENADAPPAEKSRKVKEEDVDDDIVLLGTIRRPDAATFSSPSLSTAVSRQPGSSKVMSTTSSTEWSECGLLAAFGCANLHTHALSLPPMHPPQCRC